MNKFAGDGSFMERFAPEATAAPATAGSRRTRSPSRDAAEPESEPSRAAAEVSGSAPAAPPSAAGAPLAPNKAVAAALRAKLLGRAPPAAAGPAAEPAAASGSRREVVVLPQIDAAGRAVAGAFGRAAAGEGLPDGGRKQKRVQRFGEGGERDRYFADDDKADLTELVRRQRYEGAADIDASLAENIARKARYKYAFR